MEVCKKRLTSFLNYIPHLFMLCMLASKGMLVYADEVQYDSMDYYYAEDTKEAEAEKYVVFGAFDNFLNNIDDDFLQTNASSIREAMSFIEKTFENHTCIRNEILVIGSISKQEADVMKNKSLPMMTLLAESRAKNAIDYIITKYGEKYGINKKRTANKEMFYAIDSQASMGLGSKVGVMCAQDWPWVTHNHNH